MADIDPARRDFIRALVETTYRIGEDLLTKSQNRAPIEEGELRGSAALAMIVNNDRFDGPDALRAATVAAENAASHSGRPVIVDVEVSFSTVYAARQHEELSWHHPLGGEAKYLERPLQENAGRYGKLLELAGKSAL